MSMILSHIYSAHAIFRWVIALVVVVTLLSQASQSVAAEVRPPSVIDRADIELSGMKNVWDLVLSRIDYNSFGLYRPFVLGGNRVVVHVNGRKVSDSPFDLDALPISIVERIEILSDSASALHGGQAISGAVNIVLRRDNEGGEIEVGTERPTGVGGDTWHGSVLWGGALGAWHAVGSGR